MARQRRDTNNLTGQRTGVYLRVSRADQDDRKKDTFDEERSTSTQRRIFEEWAERSGVHFADEYADPDISASRFAVKKNRPEFERMVADVKAWQARHPVVLGDLPPAAAAGRVRETARHLPRPRRHLGHPRPGGRPSQLTGHAARRHPVDDRGGRQRETVRPGVRRQGVVRAQRQARGPVPLWLPARQADRCGVDDVRAGPARCIRRRRPGGAGLAGLCRP